jgi:two-component system nitrogen regulation response regulator GlnG
MKPIWIVDDDASIRWVLEKALARENLETRSFSNAREALAAFETDTPQVLVSDIRMPGESGLDLLSVVKDRHPGLPVIIITAFSDLDSAVASFQGGAFEYLAKPFDIDKAGARWKKACAKPPSRRCRPTRRKSWGKPRPCRKSSAPSAACRNRMSPC